MKLKILSLLIVGLIISQSTTQTSLMDQIKENKVHACAYATLVGILCYVFYSKNQEINKEVEENKILKQDIFLKNLEIKELKNLELATVTCKNENLIFKIGEEQKTDDEIRFILFTENDKFREENVEVTKLLLDAFPIAKSSLDSVKNKEN